MTLSANRQSAIWASSRRSVLAGGVAAAVALAAPPTGSWAAGAKEPLGAAVASTSLVTTPDGTQIFYKDWGKGKPIVFSHGWPLNADVWDEQMMFMTSRGFRCVSFDRRGHFLPDDRQGKFEACAGGRYH